MKDLLSNVIAVIAAVSLLAVVWIQNTYIDKLIESNKLLQREVAKLLLFFDGASIEEEPSNYYAVHSRAFDEKSKEYTQSHYTASGFAVDNISHCEAEDWIEAWRKDWNKANEGVEK